MKQFLLTTAFVLSTFSAALAQTKSFIDQPYIEVNGFADSLVTPNQIFIKIIIAEKDSKDKVSLEELESNMIDALTSIGINTETDLTTSDMLSNYKFYFLRRKDIFKSKEYILKVTNAQTAGTVFLKLEDVGISNSSIDRVDHTNLENIKNKCRTKAVENAKAKAISLTKPLMQTVGSAIYIADVEQGKNNEFQGRLAGLVVTGYGTNIKPKYEAPKIEFEKINVQASISVKFILK